MYNAVMSLEDANRFWKWFDEQRGELSVQAVERIANCPRGRIGNARSAGRVPSELVIESVAAGLGLKKLEVMGHAGRLPNLPVLDDNATFRELRETYEALSPEGRQEVLRYAAFRYEQETEQE